MATDLKKAQEAVQLAEKAAVARGPPVFGQSLNSLARKATLSPLDSVSSTGSGGPPPFKAALSILHSTPNLLRGTTSDGQSSPLASNTGVNINAPPGFDVGKYKKMKKMGLPETSIVHKIRQDGFPE
eukprot:UN23474